MATYYVRASGGNDGSDGTTFAGGWATIQKAADTASAGDTVFICSDGSHAPSAAVDFDSSAGSRAAYILFKGAGVDGSDDGSVPIINGSGLPSSTDLFNINLASICVKFEGLRLTEATQNNVNIANTINAGIVIFYRCRLDNALGDGIYHQESDTGFVMELINTEIDHNGDCGIDSAGAGRGGLKVIGSSVHHNTNAGIEEAPGTVSRAIIESSLFYKNGGDGLKFINIAYGPVILNSVFFGNGGDGIEFLTTSDAIVMKNNIFRLNGGYGINTSTGTLRNFSYCDYNCYSSNTAGDIDINSDTPPGTHNLISDPKFVSETDSSENFNLQSDSPCINAGMNPNGY